MTKLFTLLFLFSFSVAQATLTYDITITGNAGSSGTGTMVIDETVCLAAGTCDNFNVAAGTSGITAFNITITGGCAAGTYSLSDYSGFVMTSDGVPDLTMNLFPQLSDFNAFSSTLGF